MKMCFLLYLNHTHSFYFNIEITIYVKKILFKLICFAYMILFKPYIYKQKCGYIYLNHK